MSHKVKTCLWFDNQALPAAEFYCSLLPDSEITMSGAIWRTRRMASRARCWLVEFTLAGTPYQAINGGPDFQLSEAVSISVAPRTRRKPTGCGTR